jgi:hypothetical protein
MASPDRGAPMQSGQRDTGAERDARDETLDREIGPEVRLSEQPIEEADAEQREPVLRRDRTPRERRDRDRRETEIEADAAEARAERVTVHDRTARRILVTERREPRVDRRGERRRRTRLDRHERERSDRHDGEHERERSLDARAHDASSFFFAAISARVASGAVSIDAHSQFAVRVDALPFASFHVACA